MDTLLLMSTDRKVASVTNPRGGVLNTQSEMRCVDVKCKAGVITLFEYMNVQGGWESR